MNIFTLFSMNFEVITTLCLFSIPTNQSKVFYALLHYIWEFRDFRRAPNGSGIYASITFVEKCYP